MNEETQKEMWEHRAERVLQLRQLGYNSVLLSYMTDEEVAKAVSGRDQQD